MERFGDFQYRNSEAFNKFIDYFNTKYDQFSPREMVKFCENLALFGLSHKEIFDSVINSIETYQKN